jgi:hypothetical protein
MRENNYSAHLGFLVKNEEDINGNNTSTLESRITLSLMCYFEKLNDEQLAEISEVLVPEDDNGNPPTLAGAISALNLAGKYSALLYFSSLVDKKPIDLDLTPSELETIYIKENR